MPGERADVSADRQVFFRDLTVEVDLATATFRLLDRARRHLLPVHLSGLANPYMPVLLRFLSLFGPYEMRQILPRPKPVVNEGLSCSGRLTCGRLVVARRRWQFKTAPVHEQIGGFAEPDAFRRLRAWRLSRNIPAQAFVYEPIRWTTQGVEALKPQLVDFSSPLHVENFCSLLKPGLEELILEEALPTFRDFPADEQGEPRATEIQIDSLALRRDIDHRPAWNRCRFGASSSLTPAEANL